MLMNTQNNKRPNWIKLFGIISLIIGITLMTLMVIFEDEPGALPLLLILIGISVLIINRLKKKRN